MAQMVSSTWLSPGAVAPTGYGASGKLMTRTVTLAFGAAEWKKYFGDVGVEPPLPSNIEQILNGPCPFCPDQPIYKTHLLVLVPQTINGKPLTLQLLGKIVQQPLQGHASQYEILFLGAYKDSAVPRSHWALMTRNVVEGSRNKSYEDQLRVLASYSQKSRTLYVVPAVLDAAVAIFMEHVRTGIRLYADEPGTITRCQEKYNAEQQCAAGHFSFDGLCVYYDCPADSIVGIGALRNL